MTVINAQSLMLMQALHVDDNDSQSLLSVVLHHHQEPQHYYHNLSHVAAVLGLFDNVKDKL